MIEVNNGLLHAAKAKYQAQIVEAVATLEIYFTNAVAIGEHPDLLAEVDKYLDMLEDAQGKINALGKHFTSQQPKENQLLQEGGLPHFDNPEDLKKWLNVKREENAVKKKSEVERQPGE